MNKERSRKRDVCFIRVLIEGNPGQVRDITMKGLKVTLIEKVDYQIGEEKELLLLPDDSFNLKPLLIKGKIRWVKKDNFYEIYGVDLNGFSNDEESLKEIVKYWIG
jgi:hypothetical protein